MPVVITRLPGSRPRNRRTSSIAAVAVVLLLAATTSAWAVDGSDGGSTATGAVASRLVLLPGADAMSTCSSAGTSVIDTLDISAGVLDSIDLGIDCASVVEHAAISPDGATLLFELPGEQVTHVFDLSTNTAATVGCRSAQWSPDSSLIGCTSTAGELDIVVASTLQVVNIITLPSGVDVDQIVFSGPTEMFVASAESGGSCTIPSGVVPDRTALWHVAIARQVVTHAANAPCGHSMAELNGGTDGRLLYVEDGELYVTTVAGADPARFILDAGVTAQAAWWSHVDDSIFVMTVSPGATATDPTVSAVERFDSTTAERISTASVAGVAVPPAGETGATVGSTPAAAAPDAGDAGTDLPVDGTADSVNTTTTDVAAPPGEGDPAATDSGGTAGTDVPGVTDVISGSGATTDGSTPDGATADATPADGTVQDPDTLGLFGSIDPGLGVIGGVGAGVTTPDATTADPSGSDPDVTDPSVGDPAATDTAADPTTVNPADPAVVDTPADPATPSTTSPGAVVDVSGVEIVAVLGEPVVVHELGTDPDDQTPPEVSFIGVQPTYQAHDVVNITCLAVDIGSGIATETCDGAVGPAFMFRGLNTLTASAIDVAGNTTTVTVSFVVTAQISDLVVVFESLVAESPTAAATLRPLVDELAAGNCATAFIDYVAAARVATESGDIAAADAGEVYALGLALCRA